MFVETLEELPEVMRGKFEAYEFNGKKGFQDTETTALANSLRNAKAEKQDYMSKFTESQAKLSEFEKNQVDALKQARAAALEEARSKGDVGAIEERYKQQLEDLEKRSSAKIEEYEQKFNGLNDGIKSEKKTNAIGDLLEFGTESGRAALKRLLSDRIDYDVTTNKPIYLNEDGGASSLDKEGFIAQIQSEAMFQPLMQADIVTSGGGNVNGGGDGGAPKPTKSRAQFEKMDHAQRQDFFSRGGKLKD